MPHIVVDEEQARIIAEARGEVEVLDTSGRHLGFVSHGFSREDIGAARQSLASDERRYTTREVVEHLESLER